MNKSRTEVIQTKCITVVTAVYVLLFFITSVFADTPWLHVDGNRIKDPNGNVVVLRGVDMMDLGATELSYGGAINMINRVTDKTNTQGSSPGWYPRVIRLAVYPSDEEDFSSPFTFVPGSDNFYNNLLRPVVDYCASKDLYAIIDWHYVGNNTWDKRTKTSTFWEYMAPRFANDSHVIFELFNEPKNYGGSDTENWISVRDDMQIWVDIVRTYAPNNLILVGGPDYSKTIGPAATYPVSDPVGGGNIAYVAHIYPGHWLGYYGEPEDYKNHITTCAAVHPVFMSEWGFSETADSFNLNVGTISNYGQPLMDFIENLKISNSAWVASRSWQPAIFWWNWTLRCGEGEMGCFVKDTLYVMRYEDQPYGSDMQSPFGDIARSIPGTVEAEDYDIGGQDVAYHDASGGNSGGEYRSDDVDIETCSERGYNVGSIEDGEWLEYAVDVESIGIYEIEVRVASATAGGNFHIRLDSVDMTGPVNFAATGDGQNWSSVYTNVALINTGRNVMRLAMDSSGWNVNWIKFTYLGGGEGTVLREWWNNIPGDEIGNLTSNVNYPDNPSGSNLLPRLEGPTDWADSYGTRIRGYVHPVTSGDYILWIASDNRSELWLSTDSNPANASLVAYVNGWTEPRNWDMYLSQRTWETIHFTAGQKYYIEVLHKEDVDNDNIAVAWEGPGLSRQVIEGVYLSPWRGSEWTYGDFTGNNFVDANDLSEFSEVWLDEGCNSPRPDMNGDCIINFYEYSLMALNWFKEIE